MSLLAGLRHRIRNLLRSEQHASELREEFDFHLSLDAMHVAGDDQRDARDSARRRFGNVTRYSEETRHVTGLGFVDTARQDIRFALRTFRHSPMFTAVAALTIALGLGATTAIYSVVQAVMYFEPLPLPDADRIVMVWMDNRRQQNREDFHSYPNLADLKSQNHVLTYLAPYSQGGSNLTGGGEPQRVAAAGLPAEAFAALGTHPLIGQIYSAENEVDGADAVVVLGYGLWQTQFGGDRSIIGRTLELNGRTSKIVAVMPPGFSFPTERTQLWVPLVVPEEIKKTARSSFAYPAIGRLAPGVSLEQARVELSGIATRLEKAYPTNRDFGVFVNPLPAHVVGRTLRTSLWVMLAAVAAVLLIACANVANLLLSRAAIREREVTVRLALGASSRRLVRQFLTESLLLSVLGGVIGLMIAWIGLRTLRSIAPADLPRLDQIAINGRVLLVTSGITIVTGLLFGLVPALRSSHSVLATSLRDAGRGGTAGRRGQRLRRGIVVAQLAIVVVLVTAAGLLIRTFATLQSVDLGFKAKNVLAVKLHLPGAKYGNPRDGVAFYASLIDRIAHMPGVKSVGSVTTMMLSSTPNSGSLVVEGRQPKDEDNEVTRDAASVGFFNAVGARIVAGRAFTPADRDSSPPVVIINQHMARYYWPNENPIGRRLHFGSAQTDTLRVPWSTVVGVVGDMRRTGVDLPVRDELFVPFAQRPSLANVVMINTGARDPLSVAAEVRSAVRTIDPAQPVSDLRTLEDELSRLIAQRRFSMTLVGAFAALALVLAMIGAYGVTSYLVSQRTKEIGVRLALGADPSRVARLVVLDGMRVAVAGVGLGVIGAILTTRLAASLLYGVSPRDPATIGGVAALLLAVAAVANYLPARRAARVDPLVALREE